MNARHYYYIIIIFLLLFMLLSFLLLLSVLILEFFKLEYRNILTEQTFLFKILLSLLTFLSLFDIQKLAD